MNIGFVGLGKLGMPVAVAMAMAGHDVMGFDVVQSNMSKENRLFRETGPDGTGDFNEVLAASTLRFASGLHELADHAEIIFVAVQTPHRPEFEGSTPIPYERADFNYRYLCEAIENLSNVVSTGTPVAIISTVLPGTMRKYIRPLMSSPMRLCYNPFFIAMGTTMRDFINPEFVLLGVDDEWAASVVERFYSETLPHAKVCRMSVESAELTKVAYNTYISSKLAIANTLMEICHKIPGANVDEVLSALKLATRRITGPAYMNGGMGDGGCVPSDELIYTEHGLRPIIDIKIGDKVLGGDGCLHPVVHCFERHYKGDILEIRVRGRRHPIRITPNHRVYVSKDTRTNLKRQRTSEYTSEVQMIPSGNLTTDYYIVFPLPSEKTQIPLPEHVSEEYLDFSGYYLSEGSLGKSKGTDRYYQVRTTFNSGETDYIEEVSELLSVMCPNNKLRVSVKKSHNTATDVSIGNRELSENLISDFSRVHVNKKLPNWLLYGSSDVAEKVLRGLFRGDGCWEEKGFTFTSVSHDLAAGVHFLLLKLGIRSTLRYIDDKRENCRRCYYVQVRNYNDCLILKDIIGMDIPDSYSRKVSMDCLFIKDDFLYSKIENIKKVPYNDSVYNIEVQDTNNYVTVTGLKSNSCHPRDNIAMSWLSRQLDLSYDWFEAVMEAREHQAAWLCDLVADAVFGISDRIRRKDAPYPEVEIFIAGYSFKAETNITTGSPAVLCKHFLEEWGYHVQLWDPFIEGGESPITENSVVLIGTRHKEFSQMTFPQGCLIVDPWRFIPDQDGVDVIRVGETHYD
jgi:UDP-glucose 6-dehydrogenase